MWGIMCSNYRPASGRDLVQFHVVPPNDLVTGQDAYPGSVAPIVVAESEGERICVIGTFGLLPGWAKDRAFAKRTYNARTETAAEKPSFRNAWRRRQLCIVPATAIYEPNYETGRAEWWRIQRADGSPMAIAGLWERNAWGDGSPEFSFSMLTVDASMHPLFRRFHKPTSEKRMIVVLDGSEIEEWLFASDESLFSEMLRPCAGDLLQAAPGRLPPS